MRRFGIVARQVFPPILRNHSSFVIPPCYSPDCVNRVPEHDRDKLDVIASLSPQQVATPVTLHFADTRQKLWLQHGLIRGGVLRLRVSVPDSCDHWTSILKLNAPRVVLCIEHAP